MEQPQQLSRNDLLIDTLQNAMLHLYSQPKAKLTKVQRNSVLKKWLDLKLKDKGFKLIKPDLKAILVGTKKKKRELESEIDYILRDVLEVAGSSFDDRMRGDYKVIEDHFSKEYSESFKFSLFDIEDDVIEDTMYFPFYQLKQCFSNSGKLIKPFSLYITTNKIEQLKAELSEKCRLSYVVESRETDDHRIIFNLI